MRHLTKASVQRRKRYWWELWHRNNWPGAEVEVPPGTFPRPHVSMQRFSIPSMYGCGWDWTYPYRRKLAYRKKGAHPCTSASSRA